MEHLGDLVIRRRVEAVEVQLHIFGIFTCSGRVVVDYLDHQLLYERSVIFYQNVVQGHFLEKGFFIVYVVEDLTKSGELLEVDQKLKELAKLFRELEEHLHF